MKNKLFKNMNMALIGLTAVLLAQTAFAQTEVMDFNENSIRVSKFVSAPSIEEDDINDFVTFDRSNSPTSQDLQDLVVNHHLHVGKQCWSFGREKFVDGATKVGSGTISSLAFVTNVAQNINRVTDTINSAQKTYAVGLASGLDVLVGKESVDGFKKKTSAQANQTYHSAKEFVEDVPKTASIGISAITDLSSGIYSLGQATYSLSMGAYHMGHIGVQASQTGFGYFSNWWNGK